MSEAFERFRDTLHAAGSSIKDNRQNHFMAQCPAHEDKNPSLGVDDQGDRIMVRCYAGCQTDDVLAELRVGFADLFDGEPTHDRALPIRSYVYENIDGSPWIIKDRYFPKTFIQRLPGTDPGDRSGLKGRSPVLYRLPKLVRALKAGLPIWLVEGEKDVETAERNGLVATCAPGGAGSMWRDEYSQFLRSATEVVIVADQDQMKPDGSLGSGQQHAQSARTGLRSVGVKVRIVAPAVGKDLTDHFAAGYTAEDFRPEPTAFSRPRGMNASDLMDHEFEPLSFAVPPILPAGLTLFAGSPKAGKSWVALDICLGVAAGGRALSTLSAAQGSSLYLAREDTYRRLQSRIALLSGGLMDAPKALELVPAEMDWAGGEQGLANMTEWAEEVGDPRLVVVDTLAKVEPQMGEERNAYSGNYTMMARYKQWADQHNCAVVLVHHDNKTQAAMTDGWMDDPFSKISGTRGLTGAADTLWFLESQRFSKEGRLHVTGRDVVEQSVELRKSGPCWQVFSVPE